MRRGPITVFLLSSVLSTAGALLFLKVYLAPGEGDSVIFVDTREEIDDLLREGADSSAASPGDVKGAGASAPGEALRRPKRRPLTETEAATFFPGLRPPTRFIYDEVSYLALRPLQVRSPKWPEHPKGRYRRTVNAQGLSRETPISEEPPALRVLMLGDSHLEGVLSTDENLCAVMETELGLARPGETIEVLNAGQGGTSFYNYLAVAERYLELDPDVVVCLVYSGNDFAGAVNLRCMFESLPPPKRSVESRKRARALREAKLPGVGQCMNQAMLLVESPEAEQIGLEAGCEVIGELARICEASGAEFVCARLPSAIAAQPGRYESQIESAKAVIGLGDAPFEVEPRLSRAWMERLQSASIEVFDLEPHFATIDRDLYWQSDMHLSVEGHRVAGRILAQRLKKRF